MPVSNLPDEVRLTECAEIDNSRELRGIPNPSKGEIDFEKKNLLGLALSGGGIRSATFNLGVLQALEEAGWLKYFDYLSTVSGGGYIGSWMLANFKRKHAFPSPKVENPPAVHHLRKYSRYLSPQLGFFSADMWVMAMIWLRNTSLLQSTLVAFLAAVLILPRIWESVFRFVSGGEWYWEALALVFWILAIVLIGINLKWLAAGGPKDRQPWCAGQGCIQIGVVIPGLLAGTILAADLWGAASGSEKLPVWITAAAVVFVSALVLTHLSLDPVTKNKFLYDVLVAATCTFFLALLLVAIRWVLQRWAGMCSAQGAWHAAVWATPLVMMALAQTVVLQIGLTGRAMSDDRREWWSRLAAWVGIYSIAFLIIAVIAIYGPLAVAKLEVFAWTKRTVAGAWIATTLGGLLAGKSKDTNGKTKSYWKEILARVAPYVFIAGLLVLISWGLHLILVLPRLHPGVNADFSNAACGDSPRESLTLAPGDGVWPHAELMASFHWAMLNAANSPWPEGPVIVLALCVLITLVLAWRVDINEFSLNHFYRNRLVRAYLGASRDPSQRSENPFTGFDFNDDLPLTSLRITAEPVAGVRYHGPYAIINTALNLPNTSDLDLEDRKADSFILTPYFCGSNRTAYTATDKFGASGGSIRLGTSVSISGAAASPNMGYHTSTAVAFLLTVFNVRLGWWVPNPRHRNNNRPGPRFGLKYLLIELFGAASERGGFLYLSDGGHFDNLGIYELVRRRCRLIVCGDAEQDKDYKFEGLAGVIRKCRIDFNAHINIDVAQIRSQDADGHNRANSAIGRIDYDDGTHGWLIYLKSSRSIHEDTDVLDYALNCPDFPHESTGNQFFSEAQFESYRHLGRQIARDALTPFTGVDPTRIESALRGADQDS